MLTLLNLRRLAAPQSNWKIMPKIESEHLRMPLWKYKQHTDAAKLETNKYNLSVI